MAFLRILLIIAFHMAPLPLHAAETLYITYDALGQIRQSAHQGTINSDITVSFEYDAAGNRSRKVITGSSLIAGRAMAIAPVSPYQMVTVSARVPEVDTGLAIFHLQGREIGRASVVAGQAKLNTYFSAQGAYLITINFHSPIIAQPIATSAFVLVR